MKKTMIIILAVLPIALLVIIAIAGKWIENTLYPAVESIHYEDRNENIYTIDKTYTITVGDDSRKNTPPILVITPSNAADQLITYTSEDPLICDVDAEGNLIPVGCGITKITATSHDGGHQALLNVRVRAVAPTDVVLSEEELTLTTGQWKKLGTDFKPLNLNSELRGVTLVSDNTDVVSVTDDGTLIAGNTAGEATVTVTTKLGGRVATCKVTVVEGTPPLYFDFEGDESITQNSEKINISKNKVLNLYEKLKVGEGIDKDNVVMKIESGADKATLEDGVLTLNRIGIVTVYIYVGDENNPDEFIKVKFAPAIN